MKVTIDYFKQVAERLGWDVSNVEVDDETNEISLQRKCKNSWESYSIFYPKENDYIEDDFDIHKYAQSLYESNPDLTEHDWKEDMREMEERLKELQLSLLK